MSQSSLKAYAILDGGGAKGAALVGCLQAAEQFGVEFIGYGGSSAGSIVALLASLHFSPRELRQIILEELDFTAFLDDGGVALRKLIDLPENVQSIFPIARYYLTRFGLLRQIKRNLGLYKASALESFLWGKIKEKLPAVGNDRNITFSNLLSQKGPNDRHPLPLRIVVSDLGSHKPRVFSAGGDFEGPVIDAVRASISYPFVFRPVRYHNSFLVDGGLSSNLPVFLFEHERRQRGVPIIAFDLVPPERQPDNSEAGFGRFCGDIFTTALESSDFLLRRFLGRVFRVPVPVPSDVRTFDFDMSKEKRELLLDVGYRATYEYFSGEFKYWQAAKDHVEQIQALHVPPLLVEPVLRSVAKSFEEQTAAKNVRTNVMLPTGYGTKIVAYQFNMDRDADWDLELRVEEGCSGVAWTTRRPAIVDWVRARKNPLLGGLPKGLQTRVRKDRRTVLSLPIFDLEQTLVSPRTTGDLDVIGVLSIDTSTQIGETGWAQTGLHGLVPSPQATEIALEWADILGRILR